MALSFFVKLGFCSALVLSSATSVFAQANFHATAGEYAIAGKRPGAQLHPAAAIGNSGGFLVWGDNVSQANGLGISALALDANLAGTGHAFRINQNINGDAEAPQVALLKNGGAVFVWQAGRLGYQQIYARFLSASNTWQTGDVLVNSFSKNFRINPSVTVLENGNVVVVWGGFNEFSSTSMQDVYAQIFTPDGQKVGVEFMVNQFSSYNQRTPSAAAMHGGGFIVTWVSEMQRSGQIDNSNPNYNYGVTNLPTVDIYARTFAVDGTPVADEFMVNTVSDVCANPNVAVAADDSYLVAWSQKHLGPSGTGWDVVGRVFSSSGGGAVSRINSYVRGDQFAPQVRSINSTYLALWTSFQQDGSLDGVFGRYLNADGSTASSEMQINSTTLGRQMHPAVAADVSGRFLALWANYSGGPGDFDLVGQIYTSEGFVPAAGNGGIAYSAPPDNGTSSVPPAEGELGSGGSAGNGFVLAFPGAPAIGTPAVNGFSKGKGTYHGLFYEQGGVAAASAGYINAKTTETGTYSAKVSLAGRTYVVAGKFNAQGLATNTVARPGASSLKVELQLDLSGGDQLIGRVTDGNWSSQLLANRMVYSKAGQTSPQAGSYTFLIAGDPVHSSTTPGGCGFGTLKVDAGGVVTFTATLADGTKVTQSSAVSKQGYWPLFVSLSGGKGVVASWIQFASQAQGDLGGSLIWSRAATIAKYYPGGFTNTISASGAMYHAPAAGTRVLNMSQGNVVLSGGGLTQPISTDVTLGLNNKVTSSAGKNLTLTITTASGLFKGTILNPANGKTVMIQGALSRKANLGVGYFLGDTTSGEVRVGGAQ